MIVKRLFQRWVDRRLPAVADVTLGQKHIFIMPNGYGLLFLLLSLVLFIGAINYQNNLVMGFSFLLFALFCVGILHTFRNLSGLRIRAAGFSPGFAGSLGKIDLHLLAASRGQTALRLYWQEDKAQSLSLAAHQEARISLSLPLTRRGWNRPTARLVVESHYPLGILRSWSLVALDCACLAWPSPLPGGDCPASGGDEHAGRQATTQGSDDFAGLRDYQAGDSLHRIDWKAYARGRGLNVREFDDPAEGRLWLEWDRLEGMPQEARLSRLCYWAQQLEQAGNPWGLVMPDVSLAPASGEAHLRDALNHLAQFGEAPP